ncbi:MAG: NADH-quinone oxidoreductase subunit L [Chlorobiales bacterium]|nr:NADH-quinone oxidoreductase subunit L [Chlorobiales bacterium]
MHEFIFFTILFPLIGFLVNGYLSLNGFTKSKDASRESIVGFFSTAMIALPFFIIAGIFIEFLQSSSREGFVVPVYEWFSAGDLSVSVAYRVDTLSLLMGLVVTGVGSLIHLYSIGYMHGDEGFARFFSYLNLFIFSMMNLILAENMVLMFLGWEGVGLCSYLLIGFWYDRKFEGVGLTWTGDAANKAFIVNRIGDFAMLAAMFLIFQTLGTLSISEILSGKTAFDQQTIFWITLLIFIGCTGKSAQIPLYIWLPDAMAGPTPVSALIHAATMVTSGIYLVSRLSPLFLYSPDTMQLIAIVGVLTALVAGTIGLVQNDIKKVLAYSTVSQLGYMFLALGIGAFSTAIFHVVTHAFFKACLFLGSGSVIHGMHEEQDIRKMGGLKKAMPATAQTFLLASLALAGFPLTAGFFSKDAILAQTFGDHKYVLYGIGIFTAASTAFYTMRLYSLTFLGEPRWEKGHHPHESGPLMTVPLWILAVLSLAGGLIGLPSVLQENNWIDGWLSSSVAVTEFHLSHTTEWALIIASSLVSVISLYISYLIYTRNLEFATTFRSSLSGLYNLLFNKYYIDELYEKAVVKPIRLISEQGFFWFDKSVIDGAVNGVGSAFMSLGQAFKGLQSGQAQNYALAIALGLVIIISYVVF